MRLHIVTSADCLRHSLIPTFFPHKSHNRPQSFTFEGVDYGELWKQLKGTRLCMQMTQQVSLDGMKLRISSPQLHAVVGVPSGGGSAQSRELPTRAAGQDTQQPLVSPRLSGQKHFLTAAFGIVASKPASFH